MDGWMELGGGVLSWRRLDGERMLIASGPARSTRGGVGGYVPRHSYRRIGGSYIYIEIYIYNEVLGTKFEVLTTKH